MNIKIQNAGQDLALVYVVKYVAQYVVESVEVYRKVNVENKFRKINE